MVAASFAYVLILYFVQGILYGFQIRVLPLYLRRSGFSYADLSILRFLTLPWLFSCVFTPLVLHVQNQRRLLTFNVVCISTCFIMIDLNGVHGMFFKMLVFLLNTVSVIQDVSLGQYLITTRASNTAALGSWQMFGYKTGTLFGGGLLFWILDYLHLDIHIFKCLALVHVIAVFIVWQAVDGSPQTGNTKVSANDGFDDGSTTEINVEKENLQNSRNHNKTISRANLRAYFEVFWTNSFVKKCTTEAKTILLVLLSSRMLKWLVLFSFLYRIGMQGAHSIFSLFLLDHSIPLANLSFLNGFCCQLVNISSSAFGGFILAKKRCPLLKLLLISAVMALVPLIMQMLICSQKIKTNIMIIGAISFLLEQVSAGLSSTATNALRLLHSKSSECKTPLLSYTLLSTAESIGKLGSSLLAMSAVDIVGYGPIYTACTFVNAFVIVLLLCKPKELFKEAVSSTV